MSSKKATLDENPKVKHTNERPRPPIVSKRITKIWQEEGGSGGS